MWITLLFTLFIIGSLWGIWAGGVCLPARARAWYWRVWGVLYLGSVAYLALLCRTPKVVRVWKLEPFEVYRQAGQCLWENSSAPVCRAVFSTRKNVFRIFQGAPLQDEWLNIVFFMPLGFLWPLLWPKKGWKSAVLGGFLLSLLVEVLQALTRRGVFETDDLINNTLGALLGYGLYRLLARPAVAPK